MTTVKGGLLRLATAGSVDDGKSTLVGRLLYDCRAIFADQWAAVEQASHRRGHDGADLALLTDGLRDEREQGITIDVAYRYFATARRRFILADTPGHVQYTRNMVTGASTAQLAMILVDARKGLVEQTRRHLAVTALLGVPEVVLAVNKMDLVGYDERIHRNLAEEFDALCVRLGVASAVAIPISAVHGDNVVNRSDRMPWYDGPTLLHHLEEVPVVETAEPARFPVQYVIRPRTPEHPDYRGYAGRLESGTLTVGQQVVVLPAEHRTTITGLDRLGRPVDTAVAGDSVTVLLADELDVARGDLIAPAEAAPRPVDEITLTACYLAERPLSVGARVLLRHGTRVVRAMVTELVDLTDIGTLAATPGPSELRTNDIGTVRVRTAQPVAPDAYEENRGGGAMLLIDDQSGDVLCAGMARREGLPR
ncbi:sulfate adenylyltransferase subunit 1 [Streptomyces sp. B1I3]|uniref:sulfate adenylyltransferase subunit 1 n=1 Tax=Streptomyces sp. B1I3 TaxID=3042264 RepID=UPI00278880E2|nr:GTP-binding protein [Streptomyces sp. B1I3]MDQ0791649.1 sulfate adenylyltransferase subunit 1 [Streptomyces sp. B1I3]